MIGSCLTKKFPCEPETAETIAADLLIYFAEVGSPVELLKNMKFVTDGCSNLAALADLLFFLRLYCAAHCLNVVLKTEFTLKVVDLNLFGDVGKKVIDIDLLATSAAQFYELISQLRRKHPGNFFHRFLSCVV